MLTVFPSEGLANRLRVIATSNKLARKSNKKLRVYWNPDKGLNAAYNELFENPDKIIIQLPTFKYRVWVYLNSLPLQIRFISKLYLGLLNFDFIYTDRMVQKVWNEEINLQEQVDKSKNAFLFSCQELRYFDAEDYQLFIPKQDLLEKINTISQKFSSNTIGVHIRSTDNEYAKIKSPFQIFIEKIEQEINKNPQVNFFVSTDNEMYQNELIKRFGQDKIIIHEKEFRRDITKGIKDAVVDIFCLSRTSKIYGSYWSSFSEIAGRLGNIPVVVLVDESILNPNA